MNDVTNGAEVDDDGVAEVEHAIRALVAETGNGDLPLIERLTAVQEGASELLSRYSAAIRSKPEDEVALEATAPGFEDVKANYEQLFASCRVTPSQVSVVAWHRKMLLKGRPRYEEASAKTGVPWWFIGIVHAMEASFNFQGHLHNGDPLARKTVQVPAGRPPQWNPPSDWLSSAIDALQYEKFTGLTDWSLARALYRWEAYNGWGYRRLNVHTPYLWSFSNHHTKGKFVKDGVYDPNAISKQCGAAVMLKALKDAGDVVL